MSKPPLAFLHHLNKSLLGRYYRTQIELFRVNPKPTITLRDHKAQRALGLTSFDVELGPDGLVHPRRGFKFLGPNGASMRPMGRTLQTLIRGFDPGCVIYRLPKDTILPETLVLLHEHTTHFSLQTNDPVELEVLNKQITAFLRENAERMTQDEFCDRYPFAISKNRVLLKKGKEAEYDWVA